MGDNKLKLIFDNASTGQKIVIASVLISIILFTTLILKWTNKPAMSLLYSNLSSNDAGAIVEKLDKQNINYELKDGNTIFVSQDDIYKLRISLAKDGLPTKKGFGYEILNSKGFGTTEFLQKINFRRALEAEIAQTITDLEPIQDVRIHIVMPDQALFKEDEKPVTAGVTLKLAGSEHLTKEQIQSIIYLVSSSVEGLQPQNITVVDTKGDILSSEQYDDFKGTSSSLTQRMEVEKYLTDKVSSMLNNVLGPDNSVVRISVELDMESIDQTDETYDPNSQVARSESISESSSQDGEKDVGGETRESEITTNYEISKSINHTVKKSGKIKNISVSVLIDGTYVQEENEDGKMITKYVPRTNQEINDITLTVQNAIGSDATRGDRITVSNMQFKTKDELPMLAGMKSGGFQLPADLFTKVLTLLLLVLGVFLIKSILKNYDLTELTAHIRPLTVPAGAQPSSNIYQQHATPQTMTSPTQATSQTKPQTEIKKQFTPEDENETKPVEKTKQSPEQKIDQNSQETSTLKEKPTKSSEEIKKLALETQDLELETKKREMDLRKKALENLELEEKEMEFDEKKKQERLKILKEVENLEHEIHGMEDSIASGEKYGGSSEINQPTQEDIEMKKLLERKRKALEKREQMKIEMEMMASIQKKPDINQKKRNLEKKRVSEYIQNNPEAANAILRSWLSK
ncbi:MAG: flagellar basal-body MS-ring/collar protein FliF [Candidatus Cloacimonadota bacterium]|nr:flagellar basal-body MS-ring/collar protein FliF [Candidatus Cloacimonadota bacterium]